MCQVCQQIRNQDVERAEELNFGLGDPVGPAASGAVQQHVGDVFDGVLSVNGTEFVEVELLAGQQYSVSFVSGDDDSDAPALSLVDGTGQAFEFEDIDEDGSDGTELVFTAETSGTYKLFAGSALSNTEGGQISVTMSQTLVEWSFDQIADYLTYGGWGNETYQWNVSPGGTLTFDVSGLTNAGKTLARDALEVWSDVTGINFQEVSFSGQISFDDNQSGAFAQFFTNGLHITSADVNVSTGWVNQYGTDRNDYAFQTYIHEIGHALGLAHSGNYDGGARYGQDNLYLNDSWQQSVMSYFDQDDNTHVNASYAAVVTPQIADILAAQELYGVAGNLRTGNTTYGDNASGSGFYANVMTLDSVTLTIIDDGGIDTIDTSSFNSSQKMYMDDETYSNLFGEVGNIGIARGTVIENFEGGSGSDLVFGNGANNTINGNNGNDSIYSGDGDDTLTGGNGNDRLVGNGGDDDLTGGAGNDVLKGKEGNNTMRGDGGDDKMIGSDDGVDTMYGGNDSDILIGLRGADTLAGQNGDDYLYGGRDDDDVSGGAGNDIVRGNLGNDTLSGGAGGDSLFGGGSNDTLSGDEDRDFLLGENGNDILDGGTGDDNLTGGAGADTFIYRDANYGYDRILDFENGTDRIDLSDFGFSGMGDINPIAADVSSGVRLNFGDGNVLLIEGISESQLDAGDFIF